MYTIPIDLLSPCLRANYMCTHAKLQYTSYFCESCSPSWFGNCSIYSLAVGTGLAHVCITGNSLGHCSSWLKQLAVNLHVANVNFYFLSFFEYIKS